MGESKNEECRHFKDKNQEIKEKIIIKTLLIEMIKVQNLKTPIHGSVPWMVNASNELHKMKIKRCLIAYVSYISFKFRYSNIFHIFHLNLDNLITFCILF